MSFLVNLFATVVIAASGQSVVVSSPAQDTAADASVTQLDDIEVTSRRLDEQVSEFVTNVAAPPRGRNLARWDREICVGTANFSPRYAQIMIDQVSAEALELGLTIGEPGCRPDVMIIASTDADALASRMIDDNPNGFRPALGGTDLGSRALRAFQNSDAPVRWWHVSLPVAAETGEIAIRLTGEEPPTLKVRSASRIRANVRDDLARVLIIVDANQIGGVTLGALCDYVTMVALAQIDPESDTSAYPSVLNAFVPTADVKGLTDWDRDYLQGLYRAERDSARTTQQARDIVREVVDANAVRRNVSTGSMNDEGN